MVRGAYFGMIGWVLWFMLLLYLVLKYPCSYMRKIYTDSFSTHTRGAAYFIGEVVNEAQVFQLLHSDVECPMKNNT